MFDARHVEYDRTKHLGDSAEIFFSDREIAY